METRTFYDVPVMEYIFYVGAIMVIFAYMMNKPLPENSVDCKIISENRDIIYDCLCYGEKDFGDQGRKRGA